MFPHSLPHFHSDAVRSDGTTLDDLDRKALLLQRVTVWGWMPLNGTQ